MKAAVLFGGTNKERDITTLTHAPKNDDEVKPPPPGRHAERPIHP